MSSSHEEMKKRERYDRFLVAGKIFREISLEGHGMTSL